MFHRVVLVVPILALLVGAPHPAAAQDPGVAYEIGPCSRTLQRPCPECEEVEGPLSGGFTLAPGPLRVDGGGVTTYFLDDLTLASADREVRGFGLLLVDGERTSFLGRLDRGGAAAALVGGSGRAVGTFPTAAHTIAFVIDEVRFEIAASPPAAPDGDGDRVGDADDLCPDTACRRVVDGGGCALDQLCPCLGRADGTGWRSHRQYVRCVITATRGLVASGDLRPAEREALVRAAADSACGRSALALLTPPG
jgi:hypothetical protein